MGRSQGHLGSRVRAVALAARGSALCSNPSLEKGQMTFGGYRLAFHVCGGSRARPPAPRLGRLVHTQSHSQIPMVYICMDGQYILDCLPANLADVYFLITQINLDLGNDKLVQGYWPLQHVQYGL